MSSIILWYIVYIVQGYLQLSRVAISTISCWHRCIEASFDSITKQNENVRTCSILKKIYPFKTPLFCYLFAEINKELLYPHGWQHLRFSLYVQCTVFDVEIMNSAIFAWSESQQCAKLFYLLAIFKL